MFTRKVKQVSSTKIFVSHVKVKDMKEVKQLTIYENYVDSINDNVMILPYPNQNDDKVAFISLKENSKIFKDMKKCFPKPTKLILKSRERGDGLYGSMRSKSLEVIEVGSYQASVAKTADDLDNLDESVFTNLDSKVLKSIKKKYSKGFGFVICKFKKGGGKKHPIAYLTHGQDELFVPLVHVHNGEGVKEYEEFDHIIYSICTDSRLKTPLNEMEGMISNLRGFEHSGHNITKTIKELEEHDITFDKLYDFRHLIIKGSHKNEDMYLENKNVEISPIKKRKIDFI